MPRPLIRPHVPVPKRRMMLRCSMRLKIGTFKSRIAHDLLFTEGQSRETFNVATSIVYANWKNGVGICGRQAGGTGFVTEKGYGGRSGGTLGAKGSGNNLRLARMKTKRLHLETSLLNVVPSRPILPASETNSKSQILFLTQQQQLDLEGKYGSGFHRTTERVLSSS